MNWAKTAMPREMRRVTTGAWVSPGVIGGVSLWTTGVPEHGAQRLEIDHCPGSPSWMLAPLGSEQVDTLVLGPRAARSHLCDGAR